MSTWTCSDCRQGLHYHDRYPDGSDAGCPASPDTTTPCACREVVHEGTDWRARATAAEAERDRLAGEVETLRARLAAVEESLAAGDASDGYHTHRELYEYRMLYNAHAARGWHAAGIPVVKSWRHSDGEECFGGGWFIVTATLPTGQVSNHYKADCWDLFDVPEVDLPPEYDGHTPASAADRLRAALEVTPDA